MGNLAKLGQHLTFLPLSISIFMQISPDSNLLTNYRYTGGFPADALVKHQRNVRNHLATLNWPWCVCRGLGVEVAGVVKAGLEEDPAGPPQLLHEALLPVMVDPTRASLSQSFNSFSWTISNVRWNVSCIAMFTSDAPGPGPLSPRPYHGVHPDLLAPHPHARDPHCLTVIVTHSKRACKTNKSLNCYSMFVRIWN